MGCWRGARGTDGALVQCLRGACKVRACKVLAFVWRSRRVRAALEGRSRGVRGAFAESLRGARRVLTILANARGAFADESGTLSVHGLLAGACGVILERSQGYRWAFAGRSRGPLWALVGRWRGARGRFARHSCSVRAAFASACVCVAFAMSPRGAQGALAALAGISVGVRRALAQGPRWALVGRWRGARGRLAGRSCSVRAALGRLARSTCGNSRNACGVFE